MILINVKRGMRPKLHPILPPIISELIKKCWDEDPNKRPSSLELLAMIAKAEEEYKKRKKEWDAVVAPFQRA